MPLKVQILKAQKILVGSVGVATLSFVGGCRSLVANLMAAPSCDVAPNASYCIGPRPDAKADTRVDANGAAMDAQDAESDALADATDGAAD